MDMQLRMVAFFAPQVLRSPVLFLKKGGLLSGAFFIFAFSLRIGCKNQLEFVLNFIDWRVKQKIWF